MAAGSESSAMRISVLGTVHEDMGRANASELQALLSDIKPEAIFLEVPPSGLADQLSDDRNNLEVVAVNGFRARHSVDLVPVDLPTPEADFFYNLEELGRIFRQKSADYCRLKSWQRQYIEEYGFTYLNSHHFSDLQVQIHAACTAALAAIADQRLSAVYDRFIHSDELRDNAMLENITSYCMHSSLQIGAFLVGADHLMSMAEKAKHHVGPKSSPIQWRFGDLR
jgi:hypothetical protein